MKKVALSTSLLITSIFSQAQAAIISIDGHFYQGTQKQYTYGVKNNYGIHDYSEIITNFDDLNAQASFKYNVNFNSNANQTAQVESGDSQDINHKTSWKSAQYMIESTAGNSPYSETLLSNVENINFSTVNELLLLSASSRHFIDLSNNSEYFSQKLRLNYGLLGTKREMINGQTVLSDFNYFYNLSLDLPPIFNSDELRDVDIETVVDMLKEHDGKYATFRQGINVQRTVYDEQGHSTTLGYTEIYTGTGVLVTQIPEPSTAWLMSLIFLFLMLNLRAKQIESNES